jgi:hypothetical protein
LSERRGLLNLETFEIDEEAGGFWVLLASDASPPLDASSHGMLVYREPIHFDGLCRLTEVPCALPNSDPSD